MLVGSLSKTPQKGNFWTVTLSIEKVEIANVMIYLLFLMKCFFGDQQKYFIKFEKIMIIFTKLLFRGKYLSCK